MKYLKFPERVWERTGAVNEHGQPLYASRPVTDEDKERRKELREKLGVEE